MTAVFVAEPSAQRLRRAERVGLGGLVVCASVFLMWWGADAVATPRSVFAAVADFPGHLLVALCVGTASAIILASSFGKNRRVRVAALASLLGSVGWMAFTFGVVAMMALVMDNFD